MVRQYKAVKGVDAEQPTVPPLIRISGSGFSVHVEGGEEEGEHLTTTLATVCSRTDR